MPDGQTIKSKIENCLGARLTREQRLALAREQQALAAVYVNRPDAKHNHQIWLEDWLWEECLILLEEMETKMEKTGFEVTDREAQDEEYIAHKVGKIENNASDTLTSTETSSYEGENFLIPCGARIIVQEDPFKEPSKIIKTPDNAKRRPTTGKVIAVGPGISTSPMDTGPDIPVIQVGDRVLFGNFSGTLVQFRNRPAFRILSEDEILAKVNATDEQLEETR